MSRNSGLSSATRIGPAEGSRKIGISIRAHIITPLGEFHQINLSCCFPSTVVVFSHRAGAGK
jgi:hypothetical protein